MGKKLRDTRGGSMENSDMYILRNMGSFGTIVVNDTSQVALQSVAQPTRNLPNILRSSSARAYKNYKTLVLDKNDVSFVPLAEDANTSFDLNPALYSDTERDGKYNKATSPKSHHQRKQVHHPLDARFDVSSWSNNNNNNNNKDKNALQTVDESKILNISLDHEEGIPTKRISNKHNSERRRCLFKKSTRTATGKADVKRTTKPSDLDTDSTIAADVNMWMTAQSDTHGDFLSDDVSMIVAEAESDELSSIFYRNNDVCKLEKKGNATRNSVASGRPTECNATQQDPLSYKFTVGENDLEDSMSKTNRSNFLLTSEQVLCTCTCANCTICDQDFVLYEDSVPSYADSDTERTELLAPYMYDFYTSDYYHVLGDMDGFDQIFSCEVTEDTSVAKEDACDDVGNCGAVKLIETNVPAPKMNAPTPVQQCELLKNSQSLCTDRVQDLCVKSSPIELVALSDESTRPSKPTERVRDFDETGYLNLEGSCLETNETTSQSQDIASSNVSVPSSRPHKSKKDLCVIQCTQCNRLFSKNNFKKHFTHCTFYKEDFKCHVCSKMYRYKSSLVQHLKAMHNISNGVYEKYYICNKCDKPYVRFRAFQRHLLVHDN